MVAGASLTSYSVNGRINILWSYLEIFYMLKLRKAPSNITLRTRYGFLGFICGVRVKTSLPRVNYSHIFLNPWRATKAHRLGGRCGSDCDWCIPWAGTHKELKNCLLVERFHVRDADIHHLFISRLKHCIIKPARVAQRSGTLPWKWSWGRTRKKRRGKCKSGSSYAKRSRSEETAWKCASHWAWLTRWLSALSWSPGLTLTARAWRCCKLPKVLR